MLTALAAFFAVALFSGCDDDKRPEPDPQPVKLASPEIVFKDVKPTSFAASWTAVEHAAAFGYKLLTTEGGQEVVVAEVASYDAVEVSFSGLKPATEYTLEVVAQAGERKTEQSVFCKPLEGENHAHGCGSQSQICQYNRVAVKSYHKIQPQSFVLLVLAL